MRTLLVLCIAVATGVCLSADGSAAGATWSGRWQLLYLPTSGGNTLTLVQKGKVVTGKLGWQLFADNGFGNGVCQSGKGGTLRGTTHGRTLKATMTFPARGGHAKTVATFTATLSRNGRMFDAKGDILTGECSKFSSFLAFTGKRIR